MSAIFYSPKQISSPMVVFDIKTERYMISTPAIKSVKFATQAVKCGMSPDPMSPFTPIQTLRSHTDPDTPRPLRKNPNIQQVHPISFELTPLK